MYYSYINNCKIYLRCNYDSKNNLKGSIDNDISYILFMNNIYLWIILIGVNTEILNLRNVKPENIK